MFPLCILIVILGLLFPDPLESAVPTLLAMLYLLRR